MKRLIVPHAWEGRGNGATEAGRKDRNDHPLEDIEDITLVNEGKLGVDLGEFELPVGTQILVSKAARDLKVAVEPGHHEKLLEGLGRLRQGVELPFVATRGHEKIPRALGRAFHENRRLDFNEPLIPQIFSRLDRHPVAEQDCLLFWRPSQVEVAIFEAEFFGFGRIQDR